MNIKRHIPNMFTLGNLFCGVLGILVITHVLGPQPNYLSSVSTDADFGSFMKPNQTIGIYLSILMGISLIFDFLDGGLARLLKVASPIGKELDSLADVVTFGVLPGLIMYDLIDRSLHQMVFTGPAFLTSEPAILIFKCIGLLVPLLSAMRLAKFNVDERQGDTFYGLPTPANAILVLSFYLIFAFNTASWYGGLFQNTWVLIILSIVCSVLLVIDLRLIALKFKNMSWKDNSFRFILIGSSVILLATLWHRSVPVIILLYFVLSIVQNQLDKKKQVA